MAKDEAYYEAEKIIQEALETGSTNLNLNHLNLVKVPDSLKQLTQLKSLNLSTNNLITLPKWLGELKYLVFLDLSHNQLTNLPETLGNLVELQELILHTNNLKAMPKWLESLTNLYNLSLSYNENLILPKSFSGIGNLTRLTINQINLSNIPEWICNLKLLRDLEIGGNSLTQIPESFGNLVNLTRLGLGFENMGNPLGAIPESLRFLINLDMLIARECQLKSIPDWLIELTSLSRLSLENNLITDLPFVKISNLHKLSINNNPLNPELAEAYKQGSHAVEAYLRAKSKAQITLNEAKLIMVGEGEVGKTCLMDALLNKPWQEHISTHGIEIQQVKVIDSKTKIEITLNGWDFGGQRVYRPTHQLFFSAPAVYLVVWKPREGPQQGFVKEWIHLIKRREPSAKILVVATHGGPGQRQPDIDRQELWDSFGKETIVDFFFVDSKPDKKGIRKGIKELKLEIARIAVELPEVGRSVPKSFADVRQVLQQKNVPYLSLDEVLEVCRENKMDDEISNLFITISHRLGHLTHYANDPILQDIVILRPDWLSTAMSYVLDDEETRNQHGLVNFSRLSQLWNDPSHETRYSENLHKIFLKLMERFDLSYRVAGLSKDEETNPVSLIAQLVPDNKPEEKKFSQGWLPKLASGDIEQSQICHIVDAQNRLSANAEGLFYQLIVRLHKYSLGRINYNDSIHWQRGLILDADYNGRALLRYIGNDIHITVRAPYPERFLAMLTEEVKYLVESFWEGLQCNITVPCLNLNPCAGLFEVEKLIENKRRNRPEQPCPICNEWQNVDSLLSNAPVAIGSVNNDKLYEEFIKAKDEIYNIRPILEKQQTEILNRFTDVSTGLQKLFSQAENNLNILMQALANEAKEGPRLFTIVPVERDKFDPRNWVTSRFQLTLWCEHSHLPLPTLNDDKKIGVYQIDLTRQWVNDYSPLIKAFTITLKSLLPVAFSAAKLALDTTIYKDIENELNFSKACMDALISESEGISALFTEDTTDHNSRNLPRENGINAQNVTLREFHALLDKVDSNRKYGNLVKVINKQQKFLWVHEKFASEYE